MQTHFSINYFCFDVSRIFFFTFTYAELFNWKGNTICIKTKSLKNSPFCMKILLNIRIFVLFLLLHQRITNMRIITIRLSCISLTNLNYRDFYLFFLSHNRIERIKENKGSTLPYDYTCLTEGYTIEKGVKENLLCKDYYKKIYI